MKRDVARFVSQCDICRRLKAEYQRPAGLLQPLEVPEWKRDHIEVDLVTGFPKSQRGSDAIFVVIDNFSEVAHFLPVKEFVSAMQLSELYTARIFFPCMVFQEISSDRGSIFVQFLEGFPRGIVHKDCVQYCLSPSDQWAG